MQSRPQNIGVLATEIYFPSQVGPVPGCGFLPWHPPEPYADIWQCVEQSALESFDGVASGKYTIGLGQTKMSECRQAPLLSHHNWRLTLPGRLLR